MKQVATYSSVSAITAQVRHNISQDNIRLATGQWRRRVQAVMLENRGPIRYEFL
jgi:hypothetical protein